MRARNIKPSLFKNEVLGVADPLLTILFEGLWCEADREGRIEDRPVRLQAEIFPYRHNADVNAMLDWLASNGFVTRYESATGTKIIQILKFSEHQKPHVNEAASVLPAMVERKHNHGRKSAQPRKQALGSDSLLSDSGFLIPDSPSLIPDSLMLPSEAKSGKPDDVGEIFDHWKVTWKHPRAALDVKRTATIKRALKGYSVADLCAAISGYLNSPHHTGQNDRQTVYDDIELFLRDASHIDAGLRFGQTPQALTSELANHNVAVLRDWKPPELRDATSGLAEISDDDGGPGGSVRQRAITAAH